MPIEKVFAIMRTIPADWPKLRVRIEHGDFIDRYVDDAKHFGVIDRTPGAKVYEKLKEKIEAYNLFVNDATTGKQILPR